MFCIILDIDGSSTLYDSQIRVVHGQAGSHWTIEKEGFGLKCFEDVGERLDYQAKHI